MEPDELASCGECPRTSPWAAKPAPRRHELANLPLIRKAWWRRETWQKVPSCGADDRNQATAGGRPRISTRSGAGSPATSRRTRPLPGTTLLDPAGYRHLTRWPLPGMRQRWPILRRSIASCWKTCPRARRAAYIGAGDGVRNGARTAGRDRRSCCMIQPRNGGGAGVALAAVWQHSAEAIPPVVERSTRSAACGTSRGISEAASRG